MESFNPQPHDNNRDQTVPGLEIVPTTEEKQMPSIVEIEGGLKIINSIIKEEGDEEDEKRNEKGHTLH